MSLTPKARAQLYRVSAGGDSSAFTVQFNPTSLTYSVQNTLEKPQGKGAGKAAQFVAQTTAKLEFDLVFDSTHDGHDVREQTTVIKKFLDPGAKAQQAAPPVIGFRWGSFNFKGYIESFRESLEFFSSDGVPLRSTLKLAMAAQDRDAVFTDDKFQTSQDARLATVPAGGTSKMASDAGNPGAGRALAAANGFESMRNPGAALAAVAGGGVQLNAAAAFSAGAGAGFGIGAGAGIGAGFGAGAAAGFGAGAGAGFGATAGAGFGATAGAGFGGAAGAGFGAGASAGFSGGAGLGASAGAGFGGAAGAGFAGAAFGAPSFAAGASLGPGGVTGFAAAAQPGFVASATAGPLGSMSAGFGGTSSAGVAAAYGAFAGLGPSRTATSVVLDTRVFEARASTPLVSADFDVGGRAIARASAGLKSDVGATARIRFD